MSSCTNAYTELPKWGICYKAASRSQGQYKNNAYIVDEGTLQEMTVKSLIGLSSPLKLFLHYCGNVDDLSVNDDTDFCVFTKGQLLSYHQVVASSTIWGTILNITMKKKDIVQLNEIEIYYYGTDNFIYLQDNLFAFYFISYIYIYI